MTWFPAFEFVLLMILSVPVVMTYRILPIQGTPYWLFGLLFVLLTSGILLALFIRAKSWYSSEALRNLLLGAALCIVVGGATVTAIVDRHGVAPVWGVHDIILQQEAAMRYLILHKNPYKETYFGTPVEAFHYDELGKPAVNPALYHFVMPPWYLLFPFPFYFLANHTIGYFDGRMVLLFCLAGLILVYRKWFSHPPLFRLAAILTALSPGVVDYFIQGRSDTFALFWYILAIFLLERKQRVLSAALFALAVLSKQTIWIAIPGYLLALWVSYGGSVRRMLPGLAVLAGVVAVVAGPFLLWDPKAFLDSTVWYLSGNTAGSYPISGYGFGMVLYEFRLIRDIHAYYPFAFWQLGLGIPVLLWSLRYYLKHPDTPHLLVGYAVTLSVIWYFSRYFNNSHMAFLATLFMLAVLKFWDTQKT
ncbi:hypothetical protein M1555_00465 [Patescibacteria group bacterium]|nr:hypothetical protein [Patescibacteria group bacterium]